MVHPVSREAFVERLLAFERRCGEAMPLHCPVHLCLGHEAVAAELATCLQPEDWLFSNHRNHGHYLAKGGSEEKLWDEIMGLESGLNGGFMGSQGIVDPEINFYAGSIIAGTVPIAVGVATALKRNCRPGVVVCCFGDAAPEEGVFWESVNFIALHKLPVLLICENNGWSVHVPIAERQAQPILRRIWAFGVTGRAGAKWIPDALDTVRQQGIPQFVEAAVTRDCPHVGTMKDLRPHA